MQLYSWQGEAPNFGDELNHLLWPALLPGFFDDDTSKIVLGIGSVLDCRHSRIVTKIVLGAGYGGYQKPPRLDRSWIIHWVRGPRTAVILGLPKILGLGDPAMLLPCVPGLFEIIDARSRSIGFMPHFESLARGAWEAVASMADMTLIDPRWPPKQVLAAIAGCSLLLSEAMHGVIVADALRVPWIALRPQARAHRPKWLDWVGALDLDLSFRPLPASSSREWMETTRPFSGFSTDRWHRPKPVATIEHKFLDRAAAALRAAAATPPALSSDTALRRSQGRMLACLKTVASEHVKVVAA